MPIWTVTDNEPHCGVTTDQTYLLTTSFCWQMTIKGLRKKWNIFNHM